MSASFEFGDRLPVGIQSQQYLIVSQVNGVCAQLACSVDGLVAIFDEGRVTTIKSQREFIADEYLGFAGAIAYRVLVLNNEPILESYLWAGLRPQLNQLPPQLFALAGRALQIGQWLADHQFCGRCGQPTGADSQDRAKVCKSCILRFYPRISPCMIVLVRRGRDLLLARHLRANRPVYSTLAGFVEAGETVEQCIHREVTEEVGVRLKRVEYVKSQSWPFPSQLMLGFFADYASGDIQIDPAELVDAQWFTPEDLPEIPSAASVAGQLIRTHLALCNQ